MVNEVSVRLYGPLNDFLPPEQRHLSFPVRFSGPRSVKDVIEGAGVPHPEIDLILLNGESVPFETPVNDGDRIAVFPAFRAIDVSGVTRTRPAPPETTRFVLDGHLGRLTRRLRLVGLDAVCPAGAQDSELAATADREGRILLTRDRELLKRRSIQRGYFVRETIPQRQLVEILRRFGPVRAEPFSRCLRCNGELIEVSKSAVESALPPRTRLHYDRFKRCPGCGRLYWQGAHWHRLVDSIEAALEDASER